MRAHANKHRTVTSLVVLPVLALAPALGGSPARPAAPVAPTPPPMMSSAAVVSPRDFVANNLLPPIHFAAETTQIRPSDTKILDVHVLWLREDRKRVLLIEGHTDEPADSSFSREVGEQRAQSAKAYLVSRGALADHIVTSSRGGGSPACKAKTAPCRAINRRATFSTGTLP